jgi:hypothetical protein
MFGLSRASDAPSTTYGSIDFAIYVSIGVAVLGTEVTGALSIVTSFNLPPALKKAVSIYKGTDGDKGT